MALYSASERRPWRCLTRASRTGLRGGGGGRRPGAREEEERREAIVPGGREGRADRRGGIRVVVGIGVGVGEEGWGCGVRVVGVVGGRVMWAWNRVSVILKLDIAPPKRSVAERSWGAAYWW